MRVCFLLFLFVIIYGCKDEKQPATAVITPTDTVQVVKDTNANSKPIPVPAVYKTPGEDAVNDRLAVLFGSPWFTVNDEEATWMKDAFDYFIVPRRKTNPTYPYISFGDYDGDGATDTAALVRDSTKTKYAIAIVPAKSKPYLWTEDISDEAAVSTMQKSTVEVIDGEKTKRIKLKSDAINIEFFETASFLIYFNKGKYNRLQTGD